MLLWVVTCICTPAMAKGVIESARPFRLLDRVAGGPLPRRSRESWRSYTPRHPWTAPCIGLGLSGPATIAGLGYQSVNRREARIRAQGRIARAIYGYGVGGSGREAGGLKREQRPRGGPGPLS